MSTIIKVTKKVKIESRYLNADLKKNMLEIFKKKLLNTCSKEYGYIINIISISKIIEIKIASSTADNILTAEIEMETIKPEKDTILSGKVCMVYPGGLFINVMDLFQILIPITNMKNFKLNIENKKFTNGESEIKENDIISIVVSNSIYSHKDKFSSYGSLI